MKILIALLLISTSVHAQTVNNATVNMQGTNQNVIITQSGGSHSASVDLRGNGITFLGSQSGTSNQSYSIAIDCGSNCPTSPYTITQY
jgi:hypothetical protein